MSFLVCSFDDRRMDDSLPDEHVQPIIFVSWEELLIAVCSRSAASREVDESVSLVCGHASVSWHEWI